MQLVELNSEISTLFYSDMEISLQEITGNKNFALNNLRRNFIEVIMYATKVVPENLAVSQPAILVRCG